MAQIGNKLKSYFNGEWGKHASKFFKNWGNRRWRRHNKRLIKKELNND